LAITVILLTIAIVYLISLLIKRSIIRAHTAEINRVINKKGGEIITIESYILRKFIHYNINYKMNGKMYYAEYLSSKTINNVHVKARFGRGEEWTFYNDEIN